MHSFDLLLSKKKQHFLHIREIIRVEACRQLISRWNIILLYIAGFWLTAFSPTSISSVYFYTRFLMIVHLWFMLLAQFFLKEIPEYVTIYDSVDFTHNEVAVETSIERPKRTVWENLVTVLIWYFARICI